MGLTAYRCCFWILSLFLSMVVGSSLTNAQTPAAPTLSENDDAIIGQSLDPDQPLTELPDFGVDWPDLDGSPDEIIFENDQTEAAEREDTARDNQMTDSIVEADADQDALSGGADSLNRLQPEDALAETKYEIAFVGLPEGLSPAFDIRFRTLSTLKQFIGSEANFGQLKRRADSDGEMVENLLRIEGYYDAVVVTSLESVDKNDVTVVINIVPGPQYQLSAVALPGLEQAGEQDSVRFRESFALESGQIINSDAIIEASDRLDEAMAENGYAFAETGEPELEIDHAERDGDLEIIVTPGGRYNFGSIIMADSDLFAADHVQMIARFDPGELYNESDVEDLRRALIGTGLISTITVEPVESQDPERVDLAVDLTPAPLRTISGQLGYGTGEGARAEVSWEHRNFFPPEGLLRLTGVVATEEQSGSIAFRRNNYRRRDNILNGRVALSNVDRDAFSARTFSVAANIERQSNLIYQKRWSWSVGVELLASQEQDVVGPLSTTSRETFFIGAIPGLVTYDASDDLLDPTSGFRLSARIAPEASLQDGSFFYIRSQLDGSAYLPVSDKIVLAGRTRIGSIVGAGNNRIAPSRRLYSGGGGSVRGYGFQNIGPRDVNNDPTGGRSLVEFSLEARIRTGFLGGNLGIVPFLDAGNVYTSSTPELSGLRYGAGLGLRYYSDFGPIRIDVGTPINPQPGDSPIAVYVSLGQAF